MAEKTFELHDGEDEKRTEDLHDFLHAANTNGVEILDWEGSDSGIDVRIHIGVGDTIAYDDETKSVTVRRKS